MASLFARLSQVSGVRAEPLNHRGVALQPPTTLAFRGPHDADIPFSWHKMVTRLHQNLKSVVSFQLFATLTPLPNLNRIVRAFSIHTLSHHGISTQ